jgi:hypothetical protein
MMFEYVMTGGALVCAMAASGCGATDGGERVASTKQGLSGEVYVSWGGTMNSAGTAYTSGAAYQIEIGVNINDNWLCELAGIAGNLTGASNNAISVFPDGGGNWWLSARAAPNNSANAAAVCFPATNAWFFEPVPGGFPPGSSQYFSGIMSVGAVTGNPAQITVSDEGSNPNVQPLHFGTWTLTTNNVDRSEVVPGYWSWSQDYSSDWNWVATSGSFSETMPAGTSCFLTSIDGNLQENSFSNGAWASVDFNTGVWTFTAASGTTAWWLCLN